MDWYEYSDKAFKRFQKQIAREFRRSRLLMPFDEINAMSVNQRMKPTGAAIMDIRRECKRLYKRLNRMNHEYFYDIWLYVYWDRYFEASPHGKRRTVDFKKYVDKWLASYDPVTKYVYDHEVERKESRLFEAVVADGASGSQRGLEADYAASERLWTNMVRQYTIDIEDYAARTAYDDADVDRVMWMSERDNRVCEDCQALDGLVFRLDRVPDKPHYGCRCKLKPWRGKG